MEFDFWIYDYNGLRGIFDEYSSIIWTGKANDIGECQIEAPLNERNMYLLKEDAFIVNPNRCRVAVAGAGEVYPGMFYEACVILNVEVDEDAKTMSAKGLFLDHLLTYRLIPRIVDYASGFDFFDTMKALFNEAFPSEEEDTARSFRQTLKPWNWTVAPDYDVLSDFSKSYKSCFETLAAMSDLTEGNLGFRTFYERKSGTSSLARVVPTVSLDLTKPDAKFTPVWFSEEFENVLGFKMQSSREDFSNVALVAGEGEGAERVLVWSPSRDIQQYGSARRELFVDARDMKREDYPTDAAYQNALRSRGVQKLVAQVKNYTFAVPAGSKYAYKRDFYLGDTVLFTMPKYDLALNVSVAEAVEKYSPSGYECEVSFGRMMESLAKRLNKRIGN